MDEGNILLKRPYANDEFVISTKQSRKQSGLMKIDLVNKSVFNRTKSNRYRNVNADFDPHKYWPL